MTVISWGLLNKSGVDPEKVEDAISRLVEAHNDDETAHLETGQSLQSHKASEIIDHLAQSIVNDKLISYARAHTAILKVPTTENIDLFFPSINYMEFPFDVVSPTKTMAEIFARTDSGDDSEYVQTDCSAEGYTYFITDNPVINLGQKLYKITVKMRCKLINATRANNPFELARYDGNTSEFLATPDWQDFEKVFYKLVDVNGNLHTINQAVLDVQYFGINYSPFSGAPGENELAISLFYINADAVSLVDQEDYFDFKECVDYINSLGGGSIFIKDGIYNFPDETVHLGSNVHVYGESLENTILNWESINENLVVGSGNSESYSAGSMTLTQNSTTVAFSGVSFSGTGPIGMYLLNNFSGHYYKIISKIDSTHLEIDQAYQGATASGLSYIILPMNSENSLENFTMNAELMIYGALNVRVSNIKMNGGLLMLGYAENVDIFDSDLFNCGMSQSIDYFCNSTFSQNTYSHHTTTVMSFASTSVGNIVEENLIIDNKGQCILIWGKNNIIKSNVILNNGWTLGQLYSAILLGSTSLKNIVSNNVIRNNNSYGIGSQTGADYNLVHGNVCIDNYSSGISNVGAHSLTNDNIV